MSDDLHKQIIQLRNNLKSDIEKYKNNIGKHMAQDIATDLTEYAQNVIEDFYSQYNPRDKGTHPNRFYYKRHGNFRDVPQRYYKKRGDIFICGVDLESNLPDVYWGAYSEPEQVFNRVMFGGLHGYASLGIPKWITNIPPVFTPSPYDRIKKKYDEIIDDYSFYEKSAAIKARKDKYILLFK